VPKKEGYYKPWFDSWLRNGRRGRPLLASDAAILCGLALKVLFQLPLQAGEHMVPFGRLTKGLQQVQLNMRSGEISFSHA
jgi:hypothetical protein